MTRELFPVSFKKMFSLVIHHEVMSEFIFLMDQRVMPQLFKIKYTPKAVVHRVNIFVFLAYDWMVKGE